MANSVATYTRTPVRAADAEKIMIQLRLAQNYGGDSPRILMLLNDLVCTYEAMFEVFETDLSEQGARQLGMIRTLHEQFLQNLVEYADLIRAQNGEFPRDFMSFLDHGPYVQPSLAA